MQPNSILVEPRQALVATQVDNQAWLIANKAHWASSESSFRILVLVIAKKINLSALAKKMPMSTVSHE
jgi:hypothetical protein